MTATKDNQVFKVEQGASRYAGRDVVELRLVSDAGIVVHRAQGLSREACLRGLSDWGYTVEGEL